MKEDTNSSPQATALAPTMDLVRKTADMNIAYLNQIRADLQHAHHLNERIQRMKRQDLALLVRRFQTSLEKKVQTATGMLGDFCTMRVLYEWSLNVNQDAREEYLLCFDLLFEAHHDTFAWANNPSQEPHPTGGRLRAEPVGGQHQRIDIHASIEASPHAPGEPDRTMDITDPFLQGLSNLVSESEAVAASNRRIEAIIDLIESMSFSFGESGQVFSSTFHARRLVSTIKLHQMTPSSAETNSASAFVGGDE